MYLWRIAALACMTALMWTVAGTDAHGQAKKKDDNIKSVSFKTYDHVTIEGTLYKNPKGKRDAVVMILHDFSSKGGNSSLDNIPDLAQQLYEDGYSVLTFDFRGHGESKSVKDAYWKLTYNVMGNRGVKLNKKDLPQSIDFKNFHSHYYVYLLYDIAAAKAFLDRSSDRGEVNSHRTLIVGAGQGATLGALWTANENRRRKDKRGKNVLVPADISEDPESADIAGCVWLTMNPVLDKRDMSTRTRILLQEVASTRKLPMAFYYGEKDSTGDSVSNSMVRAISKENKEIVRARKVDGAAGVGAKLLTEKAARTRILKDLEGFLDAHAIRENKEHRTEDYAFYYFLPGRKMILTQSTAISKKATDDVAFVDLTYMGIQPRW